MIQANELRIGNIVMFESKINTLSVIGRKAVQFEEGIGNVFKIEWLRPIPLSEDWLVKFGFEKREDIDITQIIGGSIEWYTNNILDIHKDSDGFFVLCLNNKAVELKSVHKLQNFYFEGFGQELEVAE